MIYIKAVSYLWSVSRHYFVNNIFVLKMNKNAVKQGVSPQDASYFVGKSFLSMVQDAELDCDNPRRFDDLIDEQTPGGLNEQVSVRLFKVEMIYPFNCVFHGSTFLLYCACLT